jgi:signal transduction histidine kinase
VKLAVPVVCLVGIGLGVSALLIARSEPEASLAGVSVAGQLALVGAGWALLGCGLVASTRRPASRFGLLLALAGCAWLLVEYNNPGVGSALAFTVGLVAYAACPPLVAHAALGYPDGRLSRRLEHGAVALAYLSALLLLGLLPALAYDPAAEGCSQCPRNLLAVTNAPGMADALDTLGLVLGLLSAAALAALAITRIVGSTSAARLLKAPVLVAAAVYLALVAADYAHGLGRGFLSNDDLDKRLWLGQAAALLTLVLGVVLAWVREWRARTAVARLVVELGETPAPGELRDALGQALADPGLELVYPLGDERYVDGRGRPVRLPQAEGRAVTPLLRGGNAVAVLIHKAELLDDPGLVEEVGRAATLALEHERLQAEVRAQLDQLRASRSRTVAAGDAERRRLERDLHDGAQQRLVVLSLALRLLRAELSGAAAGRVDAADAELRHAIEDLRSLARGIYPAVLADEGLASALTSLAESGRVPIVVREAPYERLDPAVEAAAYFLVAEIAKRNVSSVGVRATVNGSRLLVEVNAAGTLEAELVEIEDRIGALDGELMVERTPVGRTTVRAELPCAS